MCSDSARRLDLRSTAAMMFGHVEAVEDRIEHLSRVQAVGVHEYLRPQPLARIHLDNFANV
jgi:2-iminoacetate synthase ThiH